MNLHQMLLNKARREELSHFYLVETSTPKEVANSFLFDFVDAFLREYFLTVEGLTSFPKNLSDHPDIFILGEEEEGGEEKKKGAKENQVKSSSGFIKVEEAQAIGRFFEFRPMGKRKFCIIKEAHRINTVVANKWLKLFEEPPPGSTIFLLNPRGIKILPTIQSRAVTLRPRMEITPQGTSLWESFIGPVKKWGLAAFLEHYSKSGEDLSFWVNELVQWEAEQTEQALSKNELLLWLKDFEEMKIYHQSSTTQWAYFYRYLQEHVFPRISLE